MTSPMDVLRLAGQLIMSYGGETYRVEETIRRMGQSFGLRNVDCFAVPSGVFLSYRNAEGTEETAIIRVHSKATDLRIVNGVNTISRRVSDGTLGMEEAYAQMLQLSESRPLHGIRMLASPFVTGLASCGFAMMFGGDWLDMAIAFFCGFIMQFVLILAARRTPELPSSLIGGFLVALIPNLVAKLFGIGHVDAIIPGALMPLVPGLMMTNAIQDTILGDSLSGLSKCIQAIMVAALVAGGVLAATALVSIIPGGGAV